MSSFLLLWSLMMSTTTTAGASAFSIRRSVTSRPTHFWPLCLTPKFVFSKEKASNNCQCWWSLRSVVFLDSNCHTSYIPATYQCLVLLTYVNWKFILLRFPNEKWRHVNDDHEYDVILKTIQNVWPTRLKPTSAENLDDARERVFFRFSFLLRRSLSM